MTTFIDAFGATVTGNADGSWSRGGIMMGPCSQAQANAAFSGMAPADWVPPILPPSPVMPLPQYMAMVPQAIRLGMWSKMVSDTTLADNYNAWMNGVVANGGIVDVTQPALATLLNYCVSKSYMTQAQVNALMAVPPT